MQSVGDNLTEDQLRGMMNEVDCNKNGRVELTEFLQVQHRIHTIIIFLIEFKHDENLCLGS